MLSHLLGLLLVLIIVVVVLIRSCLCIVILLLCVILLLLLGSLKLVQGLPLLGKNISLGYIAHDNIVEDGSAFHLPQVEAQEAKVRVRVDLVIIYILGIGDLFGLPDTLVCWIGDPLHAPITLVCGIVFHGGLPLAILLAVPVIGLLRLLVHDALVFHPVVRLLVLRVIHHAAVDPVLRCLDALV